MGNPANIVRVRFLLDWRNCSVSAVGSVGAVGAVGKPTNPIHGGIVLGGVPPAPNPGIEGQVLRCVNPG